MGYATSRFGHVMFPENAHEPALHCAELMLGGVGKGQAFCLLIVRSVAKYMQFRSVLLFPTLVIIFVSSGFSMFVVLD